MRNIALFIAVSLAACDDTCQPPLDGSSSGTEETGVTTEPEPVTEVGDPCGPKQDPADPYDGCAAGQHCLLPWGYCTRECGDSNVDCTIYNGNGGHAEFACLPVLGLELCAEPSP